MAYAVKGRVILKRVFMDEGTIIVLADCDVPEGETVSEQHFKLREILSKLDERQVATFWLEDEIYDTFYDVTEPKDFVVDGAGAQLDPVKLAVEAGGFTNVNVFTLDFYADVLI